LQTGATTLVSAGAVSTNAILLSSSEAPDMTPDGRYVAFYSTATNLVAGVASSGEIYVRDTVAGTTTWASTGARNLLGSTNAISYNHALSDDGQFVAYETSTNAPLAAGSTERWGLILRYSLATGLTDLVGTNAFAPPTLTHDIHSLSMTPDGRFIAYVANANDTSGATSGILLWDAQSGLSTLVSGDAGGNIPADSVCDSPLVDPTGRFVTFVSRAPGLVTNLLLGDYHVYLRDTQAGTTTLVDADTNGVGSSVSAATAPRMSGDARLVTFECLDANLVANDRNHDYDVFIHDLAENTNELISARHQALASSTANGASVTSAQCVSSDGRFVAFASEADNLVANDTNRVRDVFVRDLGLGTNILISVATNGFGGNNISAEPALSGNGRYVAFTSAADNLVPGDTNANLDVFVRDLVTGTTALVSVRTDGSGSGNRGSSSPLIGADGRFVLFVSGATNLAIGTFSVGSVNLFLRDTVSNVTYALTTNGVAAVDMTPDGRFIVFNARSGLNGSIYVWDSQLEARVYTITTNATWLAISADGNRIAYVAGVGTFIADRGVNTTWQAGAAARRGMRLNYDGRFLAFSAGPNNTNQVYLYDSQTGATNLVSHDSSLNPTFGKSGPLAISPDGRFVVYRSTATNIVALLDKNLQADLFLYDRFTGSNNPVTTSLYQRSTADGFSTGPVISGDGLTMVFQSYASDVGMGDFNDNSDLFAETFLFVTISNAPGQGPTLSWTTRPGESYHAQFKDDVRNVNWQQVVGTIAFAGNQAHVTDLAPSAAQRFYRVVGF
jgi:Tol biopolymer transport system component